MRKQKPRQTEKSQKLSKKLAATEAANITYFDEKFPVVLKSGSGCKLRDVDGNAYLDLTACFGVHAFGHRYPKIQNAIRSQMGHLVHALGDVHPSDVKVSFLQKLKNFFSDDQASIFLGLNGSDAVDYALKTAMIKTGKSKFLCFDAGYHGLSMGPLVANGREFFQEGFQSWCQEKSVVLPFPVLQSDKNLYADETWSIQVADQQDVLLKLEQELSQNIYAALIFEPIQGRGGERTFPAGFLRKMELMCRKYNCLLIADEIFCGLYRTGYRLACESEGMTADLYCIGKALGGGLPLSACVGRSLDVWGKSTGESRHTATFLGHPLACAAGIVVLTELENKKHQIYAQGAWVQNFVANRITIWNEKFTRCGRIKQTGRGFMQGIWFCDAPPSFVPALMTKLLDFGLIVIPSGRHSNVLSLTPALNMTKAQWKWAAGKIEQALDQLQKLPG